MGKGDMGTCSCAITDEKWEEFETLKTEFSTLKQHYTERFSCENVDGLNFNGKCYFLSTGTAEYYSQASAKCGEIRGGAQLVSIKSDALYRALIPFVRSKIPESSGYYNIWTS